jgi:hypothetical protein
VLPAEVENREEIAFLLSSVWPFAQGVLQAGLELQTAIGSAKFQAVEPITRLVLVGLLVQELRKYRSALLLAEFGLDEAETMVARSLFEGLLAARFIVSRPKRADSCSPGVRGKLKSQPNIPKGRAAVEFRANVYAIYPTLRTEALFRQAGNVDGLKRTASRKRQMQAAAWIAGIEQRIGKPWTSFLQRAKSYSGLNIAEQAEAYRLSLVYRGVYGLQSFHAHAITGSRYVKATEKREVEVRLHADVHNLVRTLDIAVITFGHTIIDVSNALKIAEISKHVEDLIRHAHAEIDVAERRLAF